MILPVIVLMLGFGLATPANSQVSSVSEKRSLDFGDVAGVGEGPSSVTMSPAGVKSVSGGATDFDGRGSEAEFTVTGTKNTNFVITLPTSVTLTAPGGTATLQNFVSTPPAGVAQTFPNNGRATVKVGATLILGPAQNAGDYTGTFIISVDPL